MQAVLEIKALKNDITRGQERIKELVQQVWGLLAVVGASPWPCIKTRPAGSTGDPRAPDMVVLQMAIHV